MVYFVDLLAFPDITINSAQLRAVWNILLLESYFNKYVAILLMLWFVWYVCYLFIKTVTTIIKIVKQENNL